MEIDGPLAQKFDTAINTLRVKAPGFDDRLVEFAGMVEDQKCNVLIDDSFPLPTAFDFFAHPLAKDELVVPTVVLNPNRILSMNSVYLAADLIRTIEISIQFPDKGYEDSARGALTSSLERQRREMVVSRLRMDPLDGDIDPTKVEIEFVLERMLPREQYLSGFGINDYRKVLARQRAENVQGSDFFRLALNIPMFVNYRSAYQFRVYQLMSSQMNGDRNLTILPPQLRQEMAATAFLVAILENKYY